MLLQFFQSAFHLAVVTLLVGVELSIAVQCRTIEAHLYRLYMTQMGQQDGLCFVNHTDALL